MPASPRPAPRPGLRRPPEPVPTRNRRLEAVAALVVLALVVLLALFA